MQIHELNNFTGTLGSGAYLAIDDGNDTGKISSQGLLAATEARIDNIIAGPAPSAEEIVDARLGADGVTYPSLGDAIRDQFTDVKSALNEQSSQLYRIDGAVCVDPSDFELGNISISTSGWSYSSSSSRVRTKQGTTYHLHIGDVISLSDYTDARYYLGWYANGVYDYKGWLTEDYRVSTEGDYVILLCNRTEATQLSKDALLSLLSISNSGKDAVKLTHQIGNRIGSGVYTIYPEFTTECAVKVADGSIIKYAGYDTYASSDYILIPPKTERLVSNAVAGGSVMGIAFYNDALEFITGVGNYTNFNIPILPNYKYCRFTSYKVNEDHSDVYVKGYQEDSLISVIDYIATGEQTMAPTMTQEGAVNPNNGNISIYTGYPEYQYSDFIEIPNYTSKLATNARARGSSVGLAFYDETKTFISGSGVANYTAPTVDVDETYKYVRITNDDTTIANSIYITFTSITNDIYSRESELKDAIASGKLLKGSYTLDSVIYLDESQTVMGSECTVNVVDGGQIIMRNGSKIQGIKFVGSWSPTRTDGDATHPSVDGYQPLITFQNLSNGDTDALFGTGNTKEDAVIYIPNDNAYNCIVDGCRFENIDRLAIYAGGGRHKVNTNPIICNNYFTDCRMGVCVYGEFIRTYSNEYLRCIVACYLRGGNSNNYGEEIKCCDCGYYFPTDAVAHNEITACEVAHCGLAGIYIVTLSKALGCVINGCHFPDAPIVGENVNNLYITGCLLSTWFKYDSGKHNAITCCNVRQEYLYGHTLFDVPSDTLITLNRAMDDDSDSEVNWT